MMKLLVPGLLDDMIMWATARDKDSYSNTILYGIFKYIWSSPHMNNPSFHGVDWNVHKLTQNPHLTQNEKYPPWLSFGLEPVTYKRLLLKNNIFLIGYL